MYGFQEHLELNFDQLLQKVTPQQIFEFLLRQPFSFENRYLSPLRGDRKPGCRFEQRQDGTILFVDFGERLLRPEKTHRTCIGMLMEMYNVSYSGAVQLVCTEFGLSHNPLDYQVVVAERSYSEKNNTIITFDVKPLTKGDQIFWSQFLIKPEELTADSVFPIKRFVVKKERSRKVIIVYRYCYAIDFVDAVKIYQPYHPKFKWITNCNENHIGNIDNLPATGCELIVQKSYKDHRVIRNLLPNTNVVWFQNEGCVPSMEILKDLTERFELITIFFDNDADGVKAAIKVMSVFNSIRQHCCRVIYLPETTIEQKDPAGFVHKEGRTDTVTVLNQIGLYGKNA